MSNVLFETFWWPVWLTFIDLSTMKLLFFVSFTPCLSGKLNLLSQNVSCGKVMTKFVRACGKRPKMCKNGGRIRVKKDITLNVKQTGNYLCLESETNRKTTFVWNVKQTGKLPLSGTWNKQENYLCLECETNRKLPSSWMLNKQENYLCLECETNRKTTFVWKVCCSPWVLIRCCA